MKTAKKLLLIILCVAFLFSLCGCEIFITDSEKLLKPPALTGEMGPISEALDKSVEGEYMLSYPSSGDIRSAIAMYDVDGDGVSEAFAFYTVKSGDTTEMHINYIKKLPNGWKSLADNALEAGGIEKVAFCNLSNNKTFEILVGWEVYGSGEKKLGVYSVEGSKLKERLMEKYTAFTHCDLDGDKREELFLQSLDTAEQKNIASVYTFSEKGFNKTASCLMDGKVKSASEPIITKLSTGKTALYIDEEKGAGSITEALYMEDGELKNPLFDGNKGENTVTQRNLPLFCTDMNSDGIPEIPTSIEIPSADGSGEKAYYTNWCGFDGTTLTVKSVTVMNVTDGYYLLLPGKLFDGIAVSRNTEKRARTFYQYDRETSLTGKKMFTITAVGFQDEEKFADKNKSAVKLKRGTEAVYFVEVFKQEQINISEIKDMFRVIE